MAAVAPTKQSMLHLYADTLRASRSFSSYNFRHYFVRRTKEMFRDIQVCPIIDQAIWHRADICVEGD